jgi:hypothetical protein
MSKRIHNDSTVLADDLRTKRRVEELRLAGLVLVRTKGRLVKVGNRQQLEVRLRNFTIKHYTPFNRPAPRRFCTGLAEVAAHWAEEFRYGLTILEGKIDALVVRWDNEQEIVTKFFREEFEDPWDVRFLKYAIGRNSRG